MANEIVVYYALQSPWTYLGWQRFLQLVEDKQASATFRPIKMAPIFAASGGLPLAKRPKQRQAYRMMELKRWRDALNLPLTLEPAFFPVDETEAALMVIAHGEQGGDAGALSHAMLRAVWSEERDLADRQTLAMIAAEQGLDGQALLTAAAAQPIADRYEANTQAALADGVFGVPTFKLGDELFWGQDRLDLLARALG
ncbi:MAG: 2-hydroxychromene-2-carboxylate isomerase [Alphaproteobacteria bacterium]|nr:2-hydroxychromene-2-carboxylate isomerase [Alphaproteobacteria bacterium]